MSTMNPEIEARYKENRRKVLAQESRDEAIRRLKETRSPELEAKMIGHAVFNTTRSRYGHYGDENKSSPTLKIPLVTIIFVAFAFLAWLNG